MPATDRLLDPRAGETILDVACGNGNYSRVLGRRGVRVVACDFVESFLACARKRTSSQDGDIEYRRIDVADAAELMSLGEGRFDAAVCSMALMDIIDIAPLLESLPRLLKGAGRFIFSLPHPCFSSNDMKFTADLEVRGDQMEQVFGVEVRKYLTPQVAKSVGIINQPQSHYFFHRPLSVVLGACFSAGLVVDGLEEPAYPAGGGGKNKNKNINKNPFSWAKRPEIPAAIVVRVRPASAARAE